MYPIEVFHETILAMVKILTELGIQFHLTGGVASTAFVEPRYTQDCDLVVDRNVLSARQDAFLQAAKQAEFLVEPKVMKQAIADGDMFQALHVPQVLKLDLYPRELVEGELSRSVQVEVFPSVMLPVVSRADLTLAKTLWISKGSHKSRRDVRQLARSLTAEERTFVEDYLQRHGLTDLWQAVLSETDEIR